MSKKEHVNTKDVLEKIHPIIDNVSVKLGLIPLEVNFVKESDRWFLRVFIYSKDHAINHQDCEDMTRSLSDHLDELIPVNYYLEVSSPGADRKLKSSKEFEIFKGKKVKIKLRNPLEEKDERFITGEILDYTIKGVLKLKTQDQEEIDIEESNIKSAKLCID